MSLKYRDSSGNLTEIAGLQAFEMDETPTSGSTNPVTSDGIYTALESKEDTLTFDTAPAEDSTNPVTSGGIYDAMFDLSYSSAATHNAIYRGKSLGTSVTDDQYTAISNGTFDDMYIGDYWTINDTVYRIASFDYWYNTGNSSLCTTHHIAIVPDESLAKAAMNSSATTDGAYVGSEMYTTNIDSARTIIQTDFGSDHILTHSNLLTNGASEGTVIGWTWVDVDVVLMSETMLSGGQHWAQSGFEVGNDTTQLALFRFNPSLIRCSTFYWIRGIIDSTKFVAVATNSGLTWQVANSTTYGIRPCFGIIG